MALNAKSGTFVTTSGLGNLSITGLGFTPKVIIFFYGHTTATGDYSDGHFHIGAATSSSAQGMAGTNSSNSAITSDLIRMSTNAKVIWTHNPGSTIDFSDIAFVSMDADGFTIDVNEITADGRYNYIALGGDDLENAQVGMFSKSTTTGTQDITTVGFQPDAVLLFGNLSTADESSLNNNTSLGIGVMNGSGEQWAMGTSGQNGQTVMNNRRFLITDSCYSLAAVASDSLSEKAAYSAMLSNGFRLNWLTSSASAFRVFYVALQGTNLNVDIGTITQKTSTGTESTTGVGFQPDALMLGSVNNTSSTSVVPTSRMSYGWGTSATDMRSIWYGDTDNIGTAEANSAQIEDKIITMKTEAAGGVTTQAAAELDSLDSDGFTLDWTTADATARTIGYLALGGAGGAPPAATPNYLSMLGIG